MRHFEENATLYQTEPGQSSLGYWFVFINVQINLSGESAHLFQSEETMDLKWRANTGSNRISDLFSRKFIAHQ